MFKRDKADPRTVAAQMSSLAVAWAIAAAIAYLGLIKRAIDLVAAATPWPGVSVDAGLVSLSAARSARFVAPYGNYVVWAVAALPFAIAALAICGIAARARPQLFTVSSVIIMLASIAGEVGALLIFAAQVATRKNGTEFVVALATIILVGVLLRLQHFVRRFYRRSPAIATLVFAILTIVYLALSNGVNISSIILGQVDIWLSMIAFGIALYAGVRLARAARRARKRV